MSREAVAASSLECHLCHLLCDLCELVGADSVLVAIGRGI